MIAALLLACSDYKVVHEEIESEVPSPDSGTTPALGPEPDVDVVASGAACAPDGSMLTITLTNAGDAELLVVSLTPTGGGWRIPRHDALPWTVAPAARVTVELVGGVGAGTLSVGSSDPDEPVLDFPLEIAPGARRPTVVFTAPADDTILGTEPTTVTASVADDETPSEDLVLTWSSDVAGDVCTESATADGTVVCPWDPAERATGAHHLSLTAVDGCGLSATANLAVCQSGDEVPSSLTNASFEDPVVSGMYMFEAGELDGWEPTRGNVVEVWHDGFEGVSAWDGEQFVELNGTVAGGIVQVVSTVPGAAYSVSLAHRGRAGTDVARLLVDGVEVDRYTDGTSRWGEYTSTFTATGWTTHVQFDAVSSSGGDSLGNFLDIRAVTGPCEGFDG